MHGVGAITIGQFAAVVVNKLAKGELTPALLVPRAVRERRQPTSEA